MKKKKNFSLQNLNALPSILDRLSWVRLYVGQNLPAGKHLFPWEGDKKGHTDTVKVEKGEKTELTKAAFYLCGTEQALLQLLHSEDEMPSLDYLCDQSS